MPVDSTEAVAGGERERDPARHVARIGRYAGGSAFGETEAACREREKCQLSAGGRDWRAVVGYYCLRLFRRCARNWDDVSVLSHVTLY